jgi:putative FmdB family regulatory protein
MPLYEYTCSDCHERFEILQRMGEGADGLACPRCHGASVERQLSTFAGLTSSSAASPGGPCARPGCNSPFT